MELILFSFIVSIVGGGLFGFHYGIWALIVSAILSTASFIYLNYKKKEDVSGDASIGLTLLIGGPAITLVVSCLIGFIISLL